MEYVIKRKTKSIWSYTWRRCKENQTWKNERKKTTKAELSRRNRNKSSQEKLWTDGNLFVSRLNGVKNISPIYHHQMHYDLLSNDFPLVSKMKRKRYFHWWILSLNSWRPQRVCGPYEQYSCLINYNNLKATQKNTTILIEIEYILHISIRKLLDCKEIIIGLNAAKIGKHVLYNGKCIVHYHRNNLYCIVFVAIHLFSVRWLQNCSLCVIEKEQNKEQSKSSVRILGVQTIVSLNGFQQWKWVKFIICLIV